MRALEQKYRRARWNFGRWKSTSTPVARWGLVLAWMVGASALSAGCGAKQESKRTTRTQHVQHFECLPDRWEEPPEEIGQTPADSAPNARDIDPFLTDESSSKD